MTILVILFLLHTTVVTVCGQPQAETKYGVISGTNLPLHTGDSVNSFLGIPYAKPPVGDLRWKAPEEPEPWGGVLNATELRTACMQGVTNMVQTTHPGWTDYGEDCLHLNVYTPGNLSSGPYPVMMWIHGGSYQQGANIMYPGYFLAGLHDVVVVVPNYRLGLFGFGTLENDVMPGNYGLLDLVHALHFIQENIAGFGGDPDQVTVFGESAGARATGMMLVSPLAAGLFHGAILQSGNEVHLKAIHQDGENPRSFITQLAEQLDCLEGEDGEDGEDEAMVACLRDVGARRLQSLSVNCTEGFHCNGYQPVVDGPDGFLPDTPLALRARGDVNYVPEVVGLCSEDGFFFVPSYFPASVARGVERDEFTAWVNDMAAWMAPSFPAGDERQEEIAEAIKFYYTYWPDPASPEANRHMAGRILTDYTYGSPSEVQMRTHAPHADVFYYVFNYRSNYSRAPEWMGTTHAMDIQYALGEPYYAENAAVLADSGITLVGEYVDDDVHFADFIMALWTDFAKTGNPTPAPVTPPGGGVGEETLVWQPWTEDDQTYMWLAAETYQDRDYEWRSHAFWERYQPWLTARRPLSP